MVRTWLAAALLALLPASIPAYAQGYGAYGGGGGPGYALAQCDAKGKVHVQQIFAKVEHYTEKRKTTNPDGKLVEYEVTRQKTVAFADQERELDAKDIQVLGGTGQKIASKNLPDLLEKKIPVLVAQANQKVDPLYFKVLKKDTLILIFPRRERSDEPEEAEDNEKPRGKPKEAEQPTELPKGLQPGLGGATLQDKTFRLRQRYENTYPEVSERKVEKDGQEVLEKFTVQNTFLTITTREFDPKYVQVLRTDGRKIPEKTWRKQMKKETLVLVSADGQKVDPFYLRLFKKGSWIVVLPQPEYGMRPVPEKMRPAPEKAPEPKKGPAKKTGG